jgi:hypothetical protein
MAGKIVLAAVLMLAARVEAEALTRSEVPLRLVTLSNGDRRFAIPLKVGSTVIEAGLDSGSTGLRILPGTLQPADAASTGDSDHYAYGSGTEFIGETGKGTLAVGDASGTISLQLIKAKDCVNGIPNCPASKIPMEQFGIQGDGIPGAGFKAIFGVNMAEAEINSPLAAIGVKRWIIELPRTPAETGRLVLNPDEDEIKNFVMLPILDTYRSQRGGLHDAVTGCLVSQASKVNVCGALMMDTGAPGIMVTNGGLGSEPWPNGTPAALGFYDGKTPRAMESLTIGLREHASRLNFNREENMRGVVIYAGLSPYFAFDVLYDPQSRAIGLKPRSATSNSPTGTISPN